MTLVPGTRLGAYERIIFSSDRGSSPHLFWQSADGVGEPERLTESTTDSHYAMSTAPDGTILVRWASTSSQSQGDIYALSLKDRKLQPLIKSEFAEQNPEISHDGRWIAYQTTKTGRSEIVVRPYPDVNKTEWPVSTAVGTEPLWSQDDRELFFRSPTGAIMRVVVKPGDVFSASAPEQVVAGTGLRVGETVGNPMRTYDVSSDGRTFLVLKNAAEPETTSAGPDIIVVQNWTEELKRAVPAK